MSERGRSVRDERREEGPTVLDDVAERLGFRGFLRAHRGLDLAYRGLIAVVGFAIVLAGFALIPLPGPGWLIVFAGLALLATEFAWAERLLHYARDKVRSWTEWVTRQPLPMRVLIGLLGLIALAGATTIYVEVQGVPEWLPLIG
jgi:uncharacterized protein (TIGR02611 family)